MPKTTTRKTAPQTATRSGSKKKESTTRQPRQLKTPTPKKTRSGSKLADLATKPDTYLECREMRHAMVRVGYFHWNDMGKRAICRVSICQRCGTVRDTFYRYDGTRMDSRYDYPDHYLLMGDGNVSMTDVVIESMRRLGVAADRDSIVTPRPSRRLRSVGS